jgi:hypothetical protein
VVESLDDAIDRLLSRAKRATALDLSNDLGVPRSSVNSRLYKGIGSRYALLGGSPPEWGMAGDQSRQRVSPILTPVVMTSEPIHVDFAGGDWELRVAVRPSSRNDPIAIVEALGPRRRAVLVSDYVLTSSEREVAGPLPATVLVVAATTLAWEIAEHFRLQGANVAFDFANATRDVYLSLLAHARKSNPPESR